MRHMMISTMFCLCLGSYAESISQIAAKAGIGIPEEICLGMTRANVSSAVPDAKELLLPVGSRNPSVESLSDVRTDKLPHATVQYQFLDDRLRAVVIGLSHAMKRDENVVAEVRKVIEKSFNMERDCEIVRLDKDAQVIHLAVELWSGEKNKLGVFFLDSEPSTEIVIFDPEVLRLTDFFFAADEASIVELIAVEVNKHRKQQVKAGSVTPLRGETRSQSEVSFGVAPLAKVITPESDSTDGVNVIKPLPNPASELPPERRSCSIWKYFLPAFALTVWATVAFFGRKRK